MCYLFQADSEMDIDMVDTKRFLDEISGRSGRLSGIWF